MTVELIAVGTEILLGSIVNTNAAFLAKQCARLGLSCYYQSVVGDNMERLMETIQRAAGRADIVILSGGLGPTQDDLTKEAAAKAARKELVMDERAKGCIEEYFKQRQLEITDNNWKQAMVPQGAIVLYNANGTAPGIIIEWEKAKLILLPGPPNELIPMFEEQVAPYLAAGAVQAIYSQTVKICGIGESKAEMMVQDLIEKQGNPTIAPYAKTGEVHLRVTAQAEDEKTAKSLVKPVVKELKSRFGNYIYTTEESVTLEQSVADLLLANHLTIATAESCTGGMLAARLVNVPGISEVFKAGHITYSNKAKRKLAGVKKASLLKYGAVSGQVAEQMAKGVALFAKADVAAAITGVAGPDGGTPDKPVGLVYIACCVCGQTTVKEYRFAGNRNKIRESAAAAALTLTRECILAYYSEKTFGKKGKKGE